MAISRCKAKICHLPSIQVTNNIHTTWSIVHSLHQRLSGHRPMGVAMWSVRGTHRFREWSSIGNWLAGIPRSWIPSQITMGREYAQTIIWQAMCRMSWPSTTPSITILTSHSWSWLWMGNNWWILCVIPIKLGVPCSQCTSGNRWIPCASRAAHTRIYPSVYSWTM